MTKPSRSIRRVAMPMIVLIATVLLSPPLVPAGAQQGGQSWKGLVPGLKAQLASHPDPELAFRLSMVYAHEGMLIDGWHILKQVDQMIGGESRRPELERKIITDATAAIHQNPHDLLARYELAFASWVGGNHNTPFEQFLEITRQDPSNAMNHGYLGYIYSTHNDAKNTIAQWEEAVRLDPSNSVLHYMLGSAYYRTARTRDAALQFNMAYRDRTLYNYITRGEEP
ncbi:MAG TPA: hypothetical protein VKZ50_13800 [bacterium]|nr:hypothetical protein [bacterium]